jgi:tetraacyldisaccharide 4'-kinase
MNPLSAIFGAGVALRNALYDQHTLKVHKLSRPVVSIGNISAGGSGKTPFVIALGELLKQHGISFDVLSRGYGRSSSEIAVVDPAGPPSAFGDEPLLIARKLQVQVIVGADRYQSGLLAEKEFANKLHLLDDGFQHRRLHRDFDIVLLPASDLKDTLLPIGRLRELPSALRRADAIVPPELIENFSTTAAIWQVRRVSELSQRNGKLLAFCGIARSQQFFASLKTLGANVVKANSFGDHHRYRQQDIVKLLREKSAEGADGFVTTEKDLINLGELAQQLQPLQVVQLRLELASPQSAITQLSETLEHRTGCRL